MRRTQVLQEVRIMRFEEAQKVSGEKTATMSLWVFYNVLTWYITHRAASLNHRVEMERRLRMAVSRYF